MTAPTEFSFLDHVDGAIKQNRRSCFNILSFRDTDQASLHAFIPVKDLLEIHGNMIEILMILKVFLAKKSENEYMTSEI